MTNDEAVRIDSAAPQGPAAERPAPAQNGPRQSLLTRAISGAIDAAHGRHTLFAGAFFAVGTVFHWYHRLDATFIGFMATLMGFVFGHSVKEDYFAQGK